MDSIWAKPVYLSPLIGSGTALIGSRNAIVWSKGGVSVEATNSHLGLFTSNEVAIRAERRAALSVLRSNGFVEVRLQ